MKRFTTYLRLLLVAIGLTAGSNASAQTTLLEYGTAETAWTAETMAEWTPGGTPTLADDNSYVGISGSNGSYETYKTIVPTANSILYVSAIWRGASATGRAFEKGNASYFRFGNIVVAQNDQDKKHGYGFSGLANVASVTTFAAGSYRVDVASSTWLKIDMQINTATNTVTSFTITSEDGETTYASATNVVLTDADYTTVGFGYKKTSSVSTTNKEQLKSVKITEAKQVVATADYTIKYVCDGEEVKEAAVRTNVVGSDIVLLDSDKESFKANDKKYIYDGDGSEVSGKTVLEDGSAVVEVPFREAAVYSWTASSNYGSYTVSGTAFEGDKAYITYPVYVLDEGKLYTKAAINKEYKQAFDITEDNFAIDLEYSDAGIDAIFYTEAEDVAGMTVNNSGNAYVRSSQSAVGYTTGKVVFKTLPKGKYKIVGVFYSPTSAGGTALVYAGNRLIVNQTMGNANATGFESEFVLAKETNDIAFGAGGANAAFDYVYIQQLDAPTAEELAAAAEADHAADYVSVTVSAAGWATLFTPTALDFTGSGLKAYTAACDGTTVALTEVTNVPANTGVVLQGEAGNYDVAVAASSATEKGDLLGSATEATAFDAFEGFTLYILTEKDGKVQFNPATSGEIAAGKAYLKVAANAEVNALNVVFGGETGISAIDNGQLTKDNAIFDLSGRRVAKTQKGLYIVNGKKIVVK